MLSREEKKRQTRKSLMDSALMLVGKGENFSNISLREVAKNAGVVPTSFYRHFTDMEELGLNLVDDLGLMLRRLMRATRQHEGPIERLIHSSVEVYVAYVTEHRNYFYFMCQCRAGGTLVLRNAIRNELKYFANELATDIRQVSLLPKVDGQDLEMLSHLVVGTVAETTVDLLDLVESNPASRQEMIERTVKKLQLIFLGAGQWRSTQ